MPKPRKPVALHALEGTTPSYNTANLPDVPRGLALAPQWVQNDPEALALFDDLAAALDAADITTETDGHVVSLLVDAACRFVQQRQLLAAEGPVIDGKRNGEPVRNPRYMVLKSERETYLSLLREVALTPAARTKVEKVSPVDTKEAKDPFADFIAL